MSGSGVAAKLYLGSWVSTDAALLVASFNPLPGLYAACSMEQSPGWCLGPMSAGMRAGSELLEPEPLQKWQSPAPKPLKRESPALPTAYSIGLEHTQAQNGARAGTSAGQGL